MQIEELHLRIEQLKAKNFLLEDENSKLIRKVKELDEDCERLASAFNNAKKSFDLLSDAVNRHTALTKKLKINQ